MKNLFYFFVLVIIGCNSESEKPKVSYSKKNNKALVKDTTMLEIADLPIHFEGSPVLVYPIGKFSVYEMKRSESKSYDASISSKKVANQLDNEISGTISQVKFQEIGKDTLVSLSDKALRIERMHYLKGKQFFVYELFDTDTNQDEKIDNNDIKSLYISTVSGKDFAKIIPDLQELIDWNFLSVTNSIYIKTIDDANKNGNFDKNDKIHYFKYALDTKKIEEYNPVN
jgi:hypothetical protein